jgi:ribosomal protein L17
LVTKLMINTGTKPRRIKSNLGYRGQLDILRKNVTALIVNERIEFPENRGIVTRQYTEKLISDAILNGDQHKHTMEMASWWLENVNQSLKKISDKCRKIHFFISGQVSGVQAV